MVVAAPVRTLRDRPHAAHGARLLGRGRGGIAQTVIGLLIYGTLRNGLDNIASIDVFLKDFIRGVVLMAALVVNVLLSGRAPRDKSS